MIRNELNHKCVMQLKIPTITQWCGNTEGILFWFLFLMLIHCSWQTVYMGHCGSYSKRRRHDSEQSLSSGTSGLEYTDLEAAEALVCMSSWGQGHFLGGNRPNSCKPRPLTPASDSCDSLLPPELPEPPKDFVSLSSLVSDLSCYTNQIILLSSASSL